MTASLRPSVNWLLVCIPLAVLLEHLGHVPPPVVFFAAALAIVPVAGLIVRSTEQIATRTGDAAGGLLNLGLAGVLLIAYGLYLVFMLRTHPDFFASAARGDEPHDGAARR